MFRSRTLFRRMSILLVLALLAFGLIGLAGCGRADDSLYVYNYGEYIADGSYGIFDAVAGFEEYYEELTGRSLKVYYTTYASNEDLYAKISGGTAKYDIIVPSDYMVERMINEDLLQPIRIEEVCEEYGAECLYDNIGEDFRGLYYDPTDEYSVPYTYGRVGIIYIPNTVDEEDLTGWDLLWNEKYKGQILQFNNPRDAFGTAQYMLGYDVNGTDPEKWRECYELLLKQKSLIQSYVNDEVYNKMESGEAAIAPYYAGDFLTMKETNEDLELFYPEPTNLFVDCLCIPKSAGNPKIAALFINYMLSEEPAVATAIFIDYASPNTVVFESEEYLEEQGEYAVDILYPEDFNFADELDRYAYRNLDQDTLEMISQLWEELKIEGGLPLHVYVTAGVMAAAIVLAVAWALIVKYRRSKWY